MIKKLLTLSFAAVLLTSCGEQSEKPEPMKRTDKNLSCSDIQLEINEADFYKKQAFDKKKLGVKNIIMPLGYIDTFMSADEAIQAADARIQYLNRIFEIKHCDPDAAPDVQVESTLNENIQKVMQPQGGYSAGGGNPYGGGAVYSPYPQAQGGGY